MNYELAKKLKEAGFPQHFSSKKKEGLHYFMYDHSDDDYTEIVFKNYCEALDDEQLFYIPALPELIKECIGNGCIQLNIDESGCGAWWGTKHAKSVFEEGETTEEALVNLWLLVNKK